jgi:hypothetical protein
VVLAATIRAVVARGVTGGHTHLLPGTALQLEAGTGKSRWKMKRGEGRR